MKLDRADRATLAAIAPESIASYLVQSGWRAWEQDERLARWTHPTTDGDYFEVLVPKAPNLRDFVARVADVIAIVATFEQRPEQQVLTDLTFVDADIIRARKASFDDHTLTLPSGAALLVGARNMMLAAACAAIEPRSAYWTKKPQLAKNYVEGVRLGQSEAGSYVITIISGATWVGSREDAASFLPSIHDPFGRRVTQRLNEGLTWVSDSAQSAARTGSLDSFHRAVPHGVSANLCEALVEMGEADGALEFRFTWAPSRPAHGSLREEIAIQRLQMEAIEAAARALRETSPVPDFEVVGPVVKLSRPMDTATGEVTLLGMVDARRRPIRLHVSSTSYEIAVTAHGNRQLVRAIGTLVRDGRSFWLYDPVTFAIWRAPDDDVDRLI
jgi:hypothetical protein